MDEKPSPSDPNSQRRGFQAGRVPPELRDYYLQQLTEEEISKIIAELRELRKTGGLELADFIQELEEVVNTGEPPQ